MKTQMNFLLLIASAVLASCEKDDSTDRKVSYLDYLKDKAVIAIHILDDTKYIFTSRYCETCIVPPYSSYFPTIEEWTVVKKDSAYENYSPINFSGLPRSDNSGNLYIAKANSIYKLNNSGDYELLVNAGEYIFQSFTFDNDDNIWLYGFNNGIAFWNKLELKIYNTENSQLPTNLIHGLAVDKAGVIWITLDFKGLLKIENGNWIIIPNSEIPGLTKYSYLRGPKAIIDNAVWFEVFSPDTTSNILKSENGIWIYEFPDDNEYSSLRVDSKGTIWAICNRFDSGYFKYSALKYYSNNSWIDFDITGINKQVFTVNADDNTVYIGTSNGLVEMPAQQLKP